MTQIITKIKISIENSDKTGMDLESVLPHEVAEEIIDWVINWKKHFLASVETLEEYQNVIREEYKKSKNEGYPEK